nr:hypothetical protein 2 [Burkholderiaceae bacterium]
MSLLGGLIASAARGVEGGSQAVAALGKVGLEKDMKIDLARETANIEFEKENLLRDLDVDRRVDEAGRLQKIEVDTYEKKKDKDLKYATDPRLLDFEINKATEVKKAENKILSPVEKLTMKREQSTIDLNNLKREAEKLAFDVLKERTTDIQTLGKAIEEGNTELAAKLTRKLTLEDNLVGSASRNKRAEIAIKSAQAIADVLKTNPLLQGEAGNDLRTLMNENIEKAQKLSGDAPVGLINSTRNNTTNNPPPGDGNNPPPPGTGTSGVKVPTTKAEALAQVGNSFMYKGEEVVVTGWNDKTGKVKFRKADGGDTETDKSNQANTQTNNVSGRVNRTLQRSKKEADRFQRHRDSIKKNKRSRYKNKEDKE